MAKRIFVAMHQAIQKGLIRACHDLSEGGLAVALAEMAFAGGLGVDVNLAKYVPTNSWIQVRCFSPNRIVVSCAK